MRFATGPDQKVHRRQLPGHKPGFDHLICHMLAGLELSRHLLKGQPHLIIAAIGQEKIHEIPVIAFRCLYAIIQDLLERRRELLFPMPDETDARFVRVDVRALEQFLEIGFIDTEELPAFRERTLGEIFQRRSPERYFPDTETTRLPDQFFRVLSTGFMTLPGFEAAFSRPAPVAIRNDDDMARE